jgi:uncharacterized protein
MGKKSRVVHIEWRSRNIDRLKQFYKSAFSWKFAEPMPGYSTANTGNKQLGGGFMQLESGSPLQPGIIGFLESEDLAASEAAIREAGGQVIASSQPVEGMGRFSVFTDPDGNQLALWQNELAIKKAEKRAKKQAKRTDAARAEAERSDEKAKRKADKKAAKKARKAEKAAQKAAGITSPKKDGQKDKKTDKKKDKKKKAKRDAGVAEVGGAV